MRQRIPASAAPVRPRLPSLAIERISALVRTKRYAALIPLLSETEDLNRAMLKARDAGDWRAALRLFAKAPAPSDVATLHHLADACHLGAHWQLALRAVDRIEDVHGYMALQGYNAALSAMEKGRAWSTAYDSNQMLVFKDHRVLHAHNYRHL